jgi:hypothetical protein
MTNNREWPYGLNENVQVKPMGDKIVSFFGGKVVFTLFQMPDGKHFYINYLGKPIFHLNVGA